MSLSKILVIDDDEFTVDMIKSIVAGSAEVSSVASGSEGLDALSQDHPDLVILDVIMPGMDGFQVLRKIKASPDTAHIPVIVFSVLDDKEEKNYALSIGASDYLAKPSSADAIMQSIDKTLSL